MTRSKYLQIKRELDIVMAYLSTLAGSRATQALRCMELLQHVDRKLKEEVRREE